MRKVKALTVLLAAVLSLALIAGCGGSGGPSSSPAAANVAPGTLLGSGTFSAGPDAGDTVKLTITPVTAGTTASDSTTTSGTTGGSSGSPTPLTGTLVIEAPDGGQNIETIQLSGSAENSSSGTVVSTLTKYQLTGTESSSGGTYTVAGEAVLPALAGGPATVTSSTGDSGIVGLS